MQALQKVQRESPNLEAAIRRAVHLLESGRIQDAVWVLRRYVECPPSLVAPTTRLAVYG